MLFDGQSSAPVPRVARLAPAGLSLLDSTVKTQEFSYYKVIATGRLIEVYRAQYPFRHGNMPERDSGLHDVRSFEYKKRGAFRAMNKIRRLVQSNFDKQSKFITLTFRPSDQLNITCIPDCYVEFNKFIMRLRYKFPGIKYVAVPEFQRKNSRGAVHYHIICDMPYFSAGELAKLWGHGFIKINRIEYSKKIGVYMSKYLSKEVRAMAGYKKYYRSLNLRSPLIFYGSKAKAMYSLLFRDHVAKIEHQMTYSSQFNGDIVYTEFNFYGEGG